MTLRSNIITVYYLNITTVCEISNIKLWKLNYDNKSTRIYTITLTT